MATPPHEPHGKLQYPYGVHDSENFEGRVFTDDVIAD